jgi:crotonobetainyl-CoA:carnitine CoA-transferase CaiB-like acyl-CoA transferase
MNAAGVPCGPILTIDQVFANPQVQHLGMAQKVQSPHYGTLHLVRAPMRLSRTSTSLRRPAPAPGEHTQEVLREYGYSADEIRQLEDTKVIAPKAKADVAQ